jgi:hypothetical protein
MSLVLQPNTIFVELMDSGKNKSRMQFKTNGYNILNTELLAVAVHDAVAAITDAKIMGYGFTAAFKETDETGQSLVKCNVEERATLVCALVQSTPPAPGQSKYGTIHIPAPKDGIFKGALGSEEYNVVDVADTDLQTFLDLFSVGLGIMPACTVSDYQCIEDPGTPGNVTGKRQHRGNRKG